MKKKSIGLLMLALLSAAAVASCGGQSGDPKSTDKNPEGSNNPSSEEITLSERAKTPDSLPDDLDFEQEEVRFIVRFGGDRGAELVLGEEGEDPIKTALYRRNQKVEERLNVKITGEKVASTNPDEINSEISRNILSGDDVFDICANTLHIALRIATEDYYTNLIDAEYLDLSQPWWQGKAMEALQVGTDAIHFLTGDMLTENIMQIGVVYFNKVMFANYFDSADDLYNLVWDGGWTMEKMREYCTDVYQDLNNNNYCDEGDIAGMFVDCASCVDHFTFGTDISLSVRNKDGFPELDLYNEKTVSFVENLYRLYYECPGVSADNDYADSFIGGQFASGKLLFYPARFLASEEDWLRNMEDDYGIIPYPKRDETQEEYSTLIHNSTAILFVPVTCERTDVTFATMEALAAESYRSVTEVCYNTVLKDKYARDETSTRMMDMIRDSARMDFAYCYSALLNNAGFITRDCMKNQTNNLSSIYAGNEKIYQKKLNELIDYYTGN